MNKPQNPYDFTDFNVLIDSTIADIKLLDKELKINNAIFNAINKYCEHANLSILEIREIEFLLDTLTAEIMKVDLK